MRAYFSVLRTACTGLEWKSDDCCIRVRDIHRTFGYQLGEHWDVSCSILLRATKELTEIVSLQAKIFAPYFGTEGIIDPIYGCVVVGNDTSREINIM